MIDFRYHLVSVIAIFLALALGIVVGTTALNGGIVDTLKSSNGQIIRDKRTLEATVQDLRTQVERHDDVSAAVAAAAVAGRLTDQRVLVVVAPGASGDAVPPLQDLLTKAGAATAGVVRLRGDLLDPSKGQVLDDLVARVAPPRVPVPEGSPTDRAAAVLAAALVSTRGTDGLAADAAAKVLGGFRSANLIDVTGEAATRSRPATAAVVLVPAGSGKPPDQAGQAEQAALLALARALDSRSEGVVLAGPAGAAQPGGLVQAARADGSLSDVVSTVDAADSPTGRLVVVLALAEQVAGGSGRYGQGPGASSGAPPAAGR